jgi:spore coat protein U-like protein
MRRILVPLLGLLLFALAPSPAEARLCGLATCTCSVSTPSTLNFGAYDPFAGSDATVSGTVTVNCSSNGLLVIASLPYTLALNAGVNSGSSFSPRKMKLTTGSTLANYNVFKDSGGTQILGDGTGSTSMFSGTCTTFIIPLISNTCSVNHTYYGRAFSGQTTLVPGTYNDTLIWTLSY